MTPQPRTPALRTTSAEPGSGGSGGDSDSGSGLRLALDRRFVSVMCATAVPVALQAVVSSSRTVVDSVMTSRLGADDVAAVGYGGRVIFVVMLAVLGMADGGAVLVAQFWGSGDARKARQAFALTTTLAVTIAVVAAVVCFTWAKQIVELGSTNVHVVDLSSQYIRTAIPMTVPYAVTSSVAAGLRCVGDARISFGFAVLGLAVHISLAYALVFGHWDLPALGTTGAAWALMISSFVECLALVAYVYGRRHVMAFRARDVIDGVRSGLLPRIRRVCVPVSLSSTSWASGILIYNVLVARAGTEQLAVLSIISPLESFGIALFIGVSTASAVLVGSSLGGQDAARAWVLTKALLLWTAAIALVTCAVFASARLWISGIYQGAGSVTSAGVKETTTVLAGVFIFRAMNITMMNGLLRAGGDTVFILKVDVFTQWAVAIPLTFLAALVWRFSFPLVFLVINSEEIAKFCIAGWRLNRRTWMRNLADDGRSRDVVAPVGD
jgi:putative MATE family efflux protein